MRFRGSATAVAVLVVGFTACGDAATDSGSTNVAASTTVPAPIGPGSGTEFCDYQSELNNLDTPFDHADATPADFEKFYTETVPAALAHSAELAPAELQGDIAKVNEGIAALGTALAANGWDAATAYADPAMQAVLNDPAFEQASTVIDSYCGYGTEGADI